MQDWNDRYEVLEYNGIRVLHFDYRGLRNTDEKAFIKAIELNTAFFAVQPPGQYVLVNVENTTVNTAIMKYWQECARQTAHLVEKAAVAGVRDPIKMALLKAMVFFSRVPIHAFRDKEDALIWLASEGKKHRPAD